MVPEAGRIESFCRDECEENVDEIFELISSPDLGRDTSPPLLGPKTIMPAEPANEFIASIFARTRSSKSFYPLDGKKRGRKKVTVDSNKNNNPRMLQQLAFHKPQIIKATSTQDLDPLPLANNDHPSVFPFEMYRIEPGEPPSRTLNWKPLGFLSHIKRRTNGNRFPLSLWEV